MRKLLIVITAVLASAFTFTSCDDSNKEGTYNFPRIHYYCTTHHQEIANYISQTDPKLSSGYLSQRTGKKSDVINLEIDDFINRCNALDSDYIKSQLTGIDDYYQITLWVYNPLQALVSVKWTEGMPLTVER